MQGDKMATFKEAVNFLEKFVNKDVKDIKITKVNRNKSNFYQMQSIISRRTNC